VIAPFNKILKLISLLQTPFPWAVGTNVVASRKYTQITSLIPPTHGPDYQFCYITLLFLPFFNNLGAEDTYCWSSCRTQDFICLTVHWRRRSLFLIMNRSFSIWRRSGVQAGQASKHALLWVMQNEVWHYPAEITTDLTWWQISDQYSHIHLCINCTFTHLSQRQRCTHIPTQTLVFFRL